PSASTLSLLDALPICGFARWYLAQSELRAGRREEAIRHFEQIRRTTPVRAVLAPALLQYARLQIEAGKVNEALAILSEAGKTNPDRKSTRLNSSHLGI